MIKHDEAIDSINKIESSLRVMENKFKDYLINILKEYITQQEQRETDLLMQVTKYGMSEFNFKKVVNDYFKLKNVLEGTLWSCKEARAPYYQKFLDLEKTIKEMVEKKDD